MKYLSVILILLLGLSTSLMAIEIGEGQVMRLSPSKKRAIIKIAKLDFKKAKRLYLSAGLDSEPIALHVLRVKGEYAIVKTITGEMDKYTLYEVFLERPNLDKFKRRKLLEVEEEEKEIRYLDGKKRHYISVNTGILSLSDLKDEGEKLEHDYSLHFGFGLKYKFRAENDLGFLIEYFTKSGHVTIPSGTTDEEYSSEFNTFKIGLITQFLIGLYMQGGLTFHELIIKSDGDNADDLESKTSGIGYFFAVGYEQNFKASSWFYQYELTYYLLDYKKTEATVNGVSESENEEDLKQTAFGLVANFGYSF